MQKNCGFSFGNPRICRLAAVWMMERGRNEPFVRLKPFCKFAGAVQHFLLLPQKKTLAKEKGIGGIANFPPNPLKAPKKTASVFLDLSRADLLVVRVKPACTKNRNVTQRSGHIPEAKKRPVRLRSLAARRGFVPKGAFLSGAGGGARTRTVIRRGILSPLCLPFHHAGGGVILTPNGKRVKNGNLCGGIRHKSRYPDKIGQTGVEFSVDTLAVLPS